MQTGKITLIGYGSQGRTWALNLRDSGFHVEVVLPNQSPTQSLAFSDGFVPILIDELPNYLKGSEPKLVALLTPDHRHREFLEQYQQFLPTQSQLIVAHGYSIMFDAPTLRADLDVLLVSPKIIGPQLRHNFVEALPSTLAIGVWQNNTGKGWTLAENFAYRLGGIDTNLIRTTFAEECYTNLFVEQALLVGGLSSLLKMTFATLVKNGVNPGLAYAECFDEIFYMTQMIKEFGLPGMLDRVSILARVGSQRAGKKLFGKDFQIRLDELSESIRSGTFQESFKTLFDKPNQPTLSAPL